MNARTKVIDHYNRVKNQNYTTLVVVGNDLYERYYPTYDKPDYTLLMKDLTEEELCQCASLGIGKR